jgi:phosphoribosylaminoimidazolecarboxamide formyltransferase/IMP cyclohydrolase
MGKNMKPLRAVISVADKKDIERLSLELYKADIKIYSTPGTAKILRKNKIPVHDIAEITDFSELMEGRVKTLHTNIYGGILARRERDRTEMEKRGIELLDLVICNFYSLCKVKKDKMEGYDGVDIGGPAMVRAAAKNWRDVAVVTNPSQYDLVIHKIKQGDIDRETRKKLAIQAFSYTARYDAMILRYSESTLFPQCLIMPYKKVEDLRYGENPHQRAAVYKRYKGDSNQPSILDAVQLQGKKISYNNILDSDVAIKTENEFDEPTAVIIKHATPSGIATAPNITQAWEDAYATDIYSPFGGIVALNREIPKKLADAMAKIFWEVIIAPSFSKGAQEIFAQKKNLRLMKLENLYGKDSKTGIDVRSINGGLLVQEKDESVITSQGWRVVTENTPNKQDLQSMVFAVKCVKHVKSNALVFVKGTRTVAIGGGQTSRVDASWIAVHKGKKNISGSIMASDAFFPFRDAVDIAAEAGVTAIVQPGGSIRDDEVIKAANEQGIAMVFSGERHFYH